MADKKRSNIVAVVVVIVAVLLGIGLFFIIKGLLAKMDFNDSLGNIEEAVIEAFPGRNSIEVSGHTINIKVWVDGIGSAAKKAAENGNAYLTDWNALRDKYYLTARSLCDEFFWADDVVIYLRLVNDQDTSRNLLVFTNNVCTYDAVAQYKNGG